MESNTLATTKQAALQAAEEWTQPEGVTRVTWEGIKRLLKVIALSYPKAYPSQITLAERLGVPERTVRRWTAAAVKAGCLIVTPDGGISGRRGWSKTNRYQVIVASHREATLAREESRYSYGVAPEPSAPETSSLDPRHPARPSGSHTPEGQDHGGTVRSMREYLEDHGRQVGIPPSSPSEVPVRPSEDSGPPSAAGIVRERGTGKRVDLPERQEPDRWDRLMLYFGTTWEQMVLDNHEFRPIRPLESRRQTRDYLRAHFGSRSELEVRKMMEEFVTAVSKRDINIKPGQSAWMCFTGAWGRQRHVEVGDPYAAYRKKG